MKKVYLDSASTTQLKLEVVQEMTKVLMGNYGNPSSTHSFGRNAKNIIEVSRKSIAKLLNCTSQEIIFTSCATESNNWILRSAVKDLKVIRIITSKIEHHAVLQTVQELEKEYDVQVDYVAIKSNGEIDSTNLVELLLEEKKTLVSLMHVNNEIGNILDMDRVGQICKQHNALFHSDTVQSIGKTVMDLKTIPVDFIVASAHKFHGPKGVGFAFVNKKLGLQPLFYGGDQEKGLRPGTEGVHQIAGMTKALEVAYGTMEADSNHISRLKDYLVEQLKIEFPAFEIIGDQRGFHTILNILLPFSKDKTAMLLFYLDMKGIAVSRGSACQSGSTSPSHVLAEILSDENLLKPNLRISLSCFNIEEDIDRLIEALKEV